MASTTDHDRYAKLIAQFCHIKLAEVLGALCQQDDADVFREILKSLTPEIDKKIAAELTEKNLSPHMSQQRIKRLSQKAVSGTYDKIMKLFQIKDIINDPKSTFTKEQIELLQTVPDVFNKQRLQQLHLVREERAQVPLYGTLPISMHGLLLIGNVISAEIIEDKTIARNLIVHHGVLNSLRTNLQQKNTAPIPQQSASNPHATARPQKSSDNIYQKKCLILMILIDIIRNEDMYDVPQIRNLFAHPTVKQDRATLKQFFDNVVEILESTSPLEGLFGYSQTISTPALTDWITGMAEYKLELIKKMQNILNIPVLKEISETHEQTVYGKFVQEFLGFFNEYNNDWPKAFSDRENENFIKFIENIASSLMDKYGDFLSQKVPAYEMPLLRHFLEGMLAPQLRAVPKWQQKTEAIVALTEYNRTQFANLGRATKKFLATCRNEPNNDTLVIGLTIAESTKLFLAMNSTNRTW
jgi:hypothetical protein